MTVPRSSGDAPRIVVFGPSWVGDMIMAQSLFMTLKARGAFVGVIAPGWTEALLARMPEVDLALPADFRHGSFGLAERLRQAREIRRHHFDQAIVLPRSLKSALVPFLARIPRRTGYLGEMRYGLLNDIRPLDKTALPLTVQRFVQLGAAAKDAVADCPQPRLAADAEGVQTALAELGLERPRGPLLALCPGAEFGPAKRWPVTHFATLARDAAAAGIDCWLFGSDRDAGITADIAAAAGERDGHCVDLAGRTRLGQAIDLMSLADVVVSNDSGLMHVAAALGRPLVALYGSSSAGFTPPLSDTASVLSHDLPCRPCFQRECPLGHFRCMQDLAPQRVFAAVQAALAGQTGSGHDEGLQ